MRKDIRKTLRSTLRLLGLEVSRVARSDYQRRRGRLLQIWRIEHVLDVGANLGQYVRQLRANGYSGRVTSFEPQPEAFDRLYRSWHKDQNWEGRQVAVGASAGEAILKVTRDSVSSSLLNPSQFYSKIVPAADVARTITVPVIPIAPILDSLSLKSPRIHLKVDVQGFEQSVIDGAGASLQNCAALEIELALAPLYDGATLLSELLPRLLRQGFYIVGVNEGFVDPTSLRTLDIDVLMKNPLFD